MRTFSRIFILLNLACFRCVKSLDASSTAAADNIKYYVYNRLSADEAPRIEADVETIVRSFYQAWKPTVIAIHRLGGSLHSPENHAIVTAKLAQEDCNVLVVDWGAVANSSTVDILSATAIVADSITDFLLLLHTHFGVQLTRVQLVGFSEGAHIAGHVGRKIGALVGQQVQRITALDAAAGNYTTSADAAQCLSRDVAYFVEVIHTNAGKLGALTPIGHADYYPNGGLQQPGCVTDVCSHERAYELVREMWSTENEFLAQKCSTSINRDDCVWVNVKMGENTQISGVYYVETNERYPFGKGSFAFSFM